MSQKEKDVFVYQAKLSESVEQYDDMVEAMRRAVAINPDLTVEERNLLSVAYKNVIGAHRASWSTISDIERKEKAKGTEGAKLELIKQYRVKVESELTNILHGIIELVDRHLLKAETSSSGVPKYEAKVFYFKMKGDYYRYLAQIQVGSQGKESAENSLLAYEAASDIAMKELPPTNTIRLGLALNFSVFCYEILNSPDRACELAKKALDDAIAEVDDTSENYNDTTLIMQLIRDNLILWTSDEQQEETDLQDKDEDNS